MLPLSSTAGIRPGNPSLRQYHSPLTKWVWGCFTVNSILAVIFAALAVASYTDFRTAVRQVQQGQTGFPEGSRASDWQQLFLGAAISSAFAVGITVLFHVLALLLLCCSFKSLADPGRKFGRAFVIAAAMFVGLHVLNIALQFRSYEPMASTWRSTYHVPLRPALLNATVVTGLLSFLCYVTFAGMVAMWQDPTDVYLLDRAAAGAPAGPHA